MTQSTGELEMEWLLKSEGIEFEREVQFHPKRKWRFDFVVDKAIAIEVEGGIFTQGRHTRGKGYINDMQKYNSALTQGWRVLRYATGQINHNVIIDISLLWLNSLYHSDGLWNNRPRSYKKDEKMYENWKQRREIEKRLVSLGYQGMINGAKLV